jgi:hypothetical protein
MENGRAKSMAKRMGPRRGSFFHPIDSIRVRMTPFFICLISIQSFLLIAFVISNTEKPFIALFISLVLLDQPECQPPDNLNSLYFLKATAVSAPQQFWHH